MVNQSGICIPSLHSGTMTATEAQNQSSQRSSRGWPSMQAPHCAALVCRRTVDSLKLGGLPLEEVRLGGVHGGLGKWRPIFVTTQVGWV